MRVPIDQPYTTSQSIPFGAPDTAAKFGKHAGVDYAVPNGRNVYAVTSGLITSYVYGQYHGNVVEIFDGQNYPHCLHLSQVFVGAGQSVKEGQLVGYSGATGQGVTGPHVHFGVSKKSLPNVTGFSDFIDPNEWLKGGEPMPPEAEVHNAFIRANGRKATAEELKIYCNKPWTAPDGLYYGKVLVDLENAQKAATAKFKPYAGQKLFIEG